MGNVTENVLFKSFRRRIKKERKLFLFVLTFALYTFVLHADWWFQKLINSSPTTTKMFFDGHYKMMIRTNFICSDGKPFSFRQKMLNLYTTETSSNVTCEYWMNTILELQSSRAGPGPAVCGLCGLWAGWLLFCSHFPLHHSLSAILPLCAKNSGFSSNILHQGHH